MKKPAGALKDIYRRLYKTYGPQHWWPAKTSFEVIVGAILTQNTAWTNVEKAIRNLKNGRLLSLGKLVRLPEKTLAALIKPSGFFNIKAKRLKTFIEYLVRRHKGKLSSLFSMPLGEGREELLNVPGIGPETADSILLYAGQKPVFVVDAYTRRLFSRLGMIKPDAPYEEIRMFFEHNLKGAVNRAPTRIYNEYHALIVRHCKEHCLKTPRCAHCCLAKLCYHNQHENI